MHAGCVLLATSLHTIVTAPQRSLTEPSVNHLPWNYCGNALGVIDNEPMQGRTGHKQILRVYGL
jgi:hypothetical protein